MRSNYSSTGRRNTRKTDIPAVPGMTAITCPNCQRVLGRAYSTNSTTICDKCGCRSYTRIYGRIMVTMPYEYLKYKGYYEGTDRYIHEMKDLINKEQVEIDGLYDEVSAIQADEFAVCGVR